MSRLPSITSRYSVALHDTLTQETHRNGKELSTHYVVVKNTPFLVNISGKEPTNFRKTKITASLAYDCEPRREVTLIRSSPLEYVTHLSSNGELITIEARIHVLTSQNENSLFRVCIKLNDDELITEPLKVISKADNIKKPKDKQACTAAKKKRSSDDAFGDTLQRIEQQQQEQKNLIDMLYQQNQLLMTQIQNSHTCSVPSSPQHSVPSPISVPSPQHPSSAPSSDDTFALSTESNIHECTRAFRHFLHCYKNISCEERPSKVRLLSDLASPDDQDTLTCFMKNLLDAQTADALSFSSMDSLFDSRTLTQLVPISSPENDGLPSKCTDTETQSSLMGSWLDLLDDSSRCDVLIRSRRFRYVVCFMHPLA